MRELKFRVWWKDKTLKPTIYTEGDLFDDTWTTVEYIAIEQYTGIKDKNGKEIYEGDIVQESNCKTVVEFSTEDIGSCGCCVDRFWGSGFIVTISDNPEDCEVIGNIHENKELSE